MAALVWLAVALAVVEVIAVIVYARMVASGRLW